MRCASLWIIINFVLLGCSQTPKHSDASEIASPDELQSYPREVKDVGLVFEPVYMGNTTVVEWAENRARVYGAEVRYVYTSDLFYYAVLRDDNRWLLVNEVRVPDPHKIVGDINYALQLSVALLKPQENAMRNLAGKNQRVEIGGGVEGVIHLDQVIQDINPRTGEGPYSENFPLYITEHIQPSGESVYWVNGKPWIVTDAEVGQGGIAVLHTRTYTSGFADGTRRLGERAVDSVIWLDPK